MDICNKEINLVVFLKLVLCLLPVIEQTSAALTVVGTATCGQDVILRCQFTGSLASGIFRFWRRETTEIVSGGTSINNTKYIEDTTNSTANYFDLKIKSFMQSDNKDYTCKNNFDQFTISIQCTEPTTTAPTPAPPECEEECCTILVIFCGIFAGITVIMWVICCWLQYKKEERCQIWCCIRLIVHGFFTVIAWILWGISYWQCKECCQGCQKAVFIVPIFFGFCAAGAGIIWGIFCLQYTGIIHIPSCCGFCVCIDCKEKKKEPDFIKYAKRQLQWMDQKIADIKQNVSGGDDAAAKLKKDEQERLDTCEKRCIAEEGKLSQDSTNCYEGMIRDYIKKLRDKISELKKLQPEGNTLV